MKWQGRILVVDDAAKWRSILVRTLQREGFIVDAVSTVDDALKQLRESLYHLIVLDIRMEDADSSNTDGMRLLSEIERKDLNKAIKVIMLSAHGTKEQMRKSFVRYEVADFLEKDDLPNRQVLLDSIERAFAKVNINLSLDIQWQGVNGPQDVVLNLEIDGAHVAPNTVQQELIANELNDLLCRLFYKAERILVKPITPGKSATGVIEVQPFYPIVGVGGEVIVKFGNIDKIKKEYDNFEKYVRSFIATSGRSTVIHDDLRRTQHLGGITYSFLGVTNKRLDDFESFYNRTSELTEIQEVIDQLFFETCGVWYNDPERLSPVNLTEDYKQLLKITSEKLRKGFLALNSSVSGTEMLSFRSLNSDQTFTNPLLVFEGPPLIYTTRTCVTHGDFNQYNIMIDSKRNTWLIDFLRTGKGHILRDVSQLDSIVRFELLRSEDATLEERLTMEQKLCSVELFSQLDTLESSIPQENLAIVKAYTTVIHLRKLASKLLKKSANDDMKEYLIALFYHALNTLKFSDLPDRQREHALLCASLLAERLKLKGSKLS